MQKYPIGRFFGTTVVVWGIVTTTTAATNSFATLSVNRFFLGVFEACLPPVLTILVGQYWTRQEHAFRACIWWSGAALAGFVTDGITYSVSGTKLRGSKLEIWQVRISDKRGLSEAGVLAADVLYDCRSCTSSLDPYLSLGVLFSSGQFLLRQ
jgi:MFS family permease